MMAVKGGDLLDGQHFRIDEWHYEGKFHLHTEAVCRGLGEAVMLYKHYVEAYPKREFSLRKGAHVMQESWRLPRP
jgi:hypothetical protein